MATHIHFNDSDNDDAQPSCAPACNAAPASAAPVGSNPFTSASLSPQQPVTPPFGGVGMAGAAAGAAAATAAGGALGGPASAARFSPACSLRTDFNTQDQCYVFDIVQSPAAGAAAGAGAGGSGAAPSFAASCSNNRIKLYSADPAGGRLQHVGDLAGHAATITGVGFPDGPDAPHLLASCSYDGTVRCWDCRAGAQVQSFSANGAELYSFAASGHTVVGGSEGRMLFWDRRTGKARTCFDDTHAKEITQLHFHPLHRDALVSASVDGLVAVHDMAGAASGNFDEDEAFKAALNIETSVARIGFYGPSLERLWVTSHTETFHLWQWLDACSEDVEGGSGALADCHDAREQLASVLGGAGVDYLIQAHYDAAAGRLLLSAGTSDGDAALYPVHEPQTAAAAAAAAAAGGGAAALFGAPLAVLPAGPGAHSSVVRSLLCVAGAAQPMVVTGGEDGRVCTWLPGGGQQHQAPSPQSSGEGRAVRRPSKHAKKHSGPY